MSPQRLIHRAWYVQHKNLIGYLILVAAVVFALAGTRSNSQDTERVAAQTHAAICTLRADLQRRVDDGDAFLKRHPHGIPGISRADIQRSLVGQRSTIKALAIADC